MRFISVRDLRGKSGEVWKWLGEERELVVTSNGKPIAILCPTSEDRLEESLGAIRTAQAIAAVEALQRESAEKGKDRLTPKEIDAEIQAVRKARSR
jgi:antitoxin (DNA-binding transcriptional repressor) of toxin-antitoxin stability system